VLSRARGEDDVVNPTSGEWINPTTLWISPRAIGKPESLLP
jgi:hypothetical protein